MLLSTSFMSSSLLKINSCLIFFIFFKKIFLWSLLYRETCHITKQTSVNSLSRKFLQNSTDICLIMLEAIAKTTGTIENKVVIWSPWVCTMIHLLSSRNFVVTPTFAFVPGSSSFSYEGMDHLWDKRMTRILGRCSQQWSQDDCGIHNQILQIESQI